MNVEAGFTKEFLRGDIAFPDVSVDSRAFGSVAEVREDCVKHLEPVPELSMLGMDTYPCDIGIVKFWKPDLSIDGISEKSTVACQREHISMNFSGFTEFFKVAIAIAKAACVEFRDPLKRFPVMHFLKLFHIYLSIF